MQLGEKVTYQGKEYLVVGLSRMIYDKDCEGEPEWKVTEFVQEVALAEPFEGPHVFVKPLWVPVTDVICTY